MDPVELQADIRNEVNQSLDIWAHLLKEHGVQYTYAKGSAVKVWNSIIDYVPLISDVDIHYKSIEENQSEMGFLDFPLRYEKSFLDAIPNPIHIPRMQVMEIRKFSDGIYVPPKPDQITNLIGDPIIPEPPSIEQIRKIDKSNLLALKPILQKLPESVFDKTRIELWSQLRKINWRISPTPPRIISQFHDDPLDVWGWNRTKLVKELRKYNYDKLADAYKEYYIQGWSLFESGLKSTSTYIVMIKSAISVFNEALNIVENAQN